MRTIDCRGLSCPQPVVLFAQASGEDGASPMDLLVDNPASLENLSRAARKKGWTVKAVEAPELGGGVVRIELRK